MINEILSRYERGSEHLTNAAYIQKNPQELIADVGNYADVVYFQWPEKEKMNGLKIPPDETLQNLQTFIVVLDAIQLGHGNFETSFREKVKAIIEPYGEAVQLLYEATPAAVSEEFLMKYKPIYQGWLRLMDEEADAANKRFAEEQQKNIDRFK